MSDQRILIKCYILQLKRKQSQQNPACTAPLYLYTEYLLPTPPKNFILIYSWGKKQLIQCPIVFL